ncbi:MlrC C-terminal domain-containing protein [Rhodobacter sp. 24-YEA-8]|uniref:MlrC C-terminal domain-containing protein n=1 Tax=Rhodobacter sp. 24-YEA-8 TaxID=1884310 RepID=UPI0008997827|nr:MlrC C-terminal domain-containing protein [Rhodobacter sp. 24-YEA-8]SEC70640.1 MlrC C-terminus [Rhodobacter sp. 24-YEA-8]
MRLRRARGVAIGAPWAPVAAQLCFVAGEGAGKPLRFDARSAPETGKHCDALIRVIGLNAEAEMRFGESIALVGPAAQIAPLDRAGETTGIAVLLKTLRVQSYDPSLFTALGIDPVAQNIVVIRSTNHFCAAFAPIASEVLYCGAGKPYPNIPAPNPYRLVRADIWPRMDDPFGEM